MPALKIMLTITHYAMKDYNANIKFKDVQNLFDKYVDEGGSQLEFFTKVIMDIYKVSGFFTESQTEMMEEKQEEMKEMLIINSYTELIEGLYPQFLDMGYSPSLFWDSSLQEVYDLMDSYNRRKKNEINELEDKLKAEISLNAVLARQIGEYVASLFNKEAQLTPLNKFFPSLFAEDKEEVNNDMALYKAKMEEYAYRHNQKLRKGGVTWMV